MSLVQRVRETVRVDGPVAWARTMVADPDVVYLDTETTGLGSTDQIIDIAVIDGQDRVLLDTLVRPTCPIPAASSAIHGLYVHHLAGAPTWADVYHALLPVLDGRRVVIYNADYDSRMLDQCCRMARVPLPRCRWECAMRAYAEYAGQRDRHGNHYRWHKLDRAAASFGLAPGGHRALSDARACRQIVRGMAHMT